MMPFRPTGRRFGARAWVHVVAGLVLAAALTGCGPAGTGLQPGAASQFQQHVMVVSQAAAANDHGAALQALGSLEADLAAAAGNGEVSEERRRTIMTSIAAVRADLNAAVEAAEAAAAQAAEEAAAAEAQAAAEAERAKAAAETPPATAPDSPEPAAPAPLPAPAPPQEQTSPGQEQGKGSEGKGRGKND